MEATKVRRKDKRLIVVHDGDAIEGVHHGSQQIITYSKDEQADLHVDLMDTFLQTVNFSRKQGDRLYYVSGTETHVEDKEDRIANNLPAEKDKDGRRVWDFLELIVNGRRVWFLHHGKGRGAGANEGNSFRNWLRDIYWDCKKTGTPPPDLVISGHTHTPIYNTYVIRNGDGYHTIHGVIAPSWQSKTRFAYKVAPVERNEIGIVFVEIKADGEIVTPVILIKETGKVEGIRV